MYYQDINTLSWYKLPRGLGVKTSNWRHMQLFKKCVQSEWEAAL